jgi:type I restriction enzyme, S subunit
MSKTNENIFVPKLRFPESVNDEGWRQKQLQDVCEINPKVSVLPDEFVYVDLESVEKGNLLQKKIIKKDEAPSRAQRLLTNNDIAFQTVRPYQKNNYYFKSNDEYEYVASTGYAQLRAFESSAFLFQLIHTDRFVSNVLKKCTGSNYPAINSSDLSLIIVEVPSNNQEQQKIATCLSSLDEVITAESQKLEALKQHKKGLLQNLFPQEGETAPKFRFKKFEESGEWVFDEFSEYIKLYRGSSPRPIQNYFTTDADGVNWIKIGDTKNADNFIINQVDERITPEGAEKSRKVNVGELVLANSMSFGKTYQLAIEGYIYDGWFVLREYEEYFDKQFLMQLLNSDYMQNQYKKFSAGGIVQNISSDIVYKTILPHISIKEQQKIASCLSSLDKIISAQSQKIEALKLHKKGLLQGLFPNVNRTDSIGLESGLYSTPSKLNKK